MKLHMRMREWYTLPKEERAQYIAAAMGDDILAGVIFKYGR